MQYFEAQGFDIALVYMNLPFDGILMARALGIPYVIYHEPTRLSGPFQFFEPSQGTNERPMDLNPADDAKHFISVKFPNLNFTPFLAAFFPVLFYKEYFEKDYYARGSVRLGARYDNFDFLHSWDLSYRLGFDLPGLNF